MAKAANKTIRGISYWYSQTIYSWITYIAITCIAVLLYFEGLFQTVMMISGGVMASSIFSWCLAASF